MTAPTFQPDVPPTSSSRLDQLPPSAESPAERQREWSAAQRVGFRFLSIYVLIYFFPGPVDGLPGFGWIGPAMTRIMHVLVPWFASNVLRMTETVSVLPSGSGDKLFDWVQITMMLTLAAVGAIAWTVADRRSKAHPRLFAAFHLYVCFTLAAILLSYGLDKVIPNQFEPMNPVRLTQYFGEAAPGGFAWFFLGFSVPYVIFCGAGETIGGFLLFFRRTTTLGALVGGAVLTNVFALNMAYDIPVKQYSFHLLALCAFLAACDADRLLNLFVRNRAVAPRHDLSLFATPMARRIATTVGTVLVLTFVGTHLRSEYQGLHQYGRLAPRSPLYGIYEFQEVQKNGVAQPPLLTDRTLWRRLSVNNNFGMVRFATDSVARFGMRVDSIAHTVRFVTGRDTTKTLSFAYVLPDSAHLELRGRVAADTVVMRFTRRGMDSYLLVNRGFHWVNEFPFFR